MTGLIFAGVAAMVAGILPWLFLAARRWGAVVAVAAAVLMTLCLLFLVMIATAALGLPLVGTIITVWALLAFVGVALVIRGAAAGLPRERSGWVVVLPSLLGGVVWLSVLILAQVVDGASRHAWVMQGDSANNVLFARGVISEGGVTIGATENPVPLPSAVLAAVISFGRGFVGAENLLRHDAAGFELIWGFGVALTCVLAGLASSSVAQSAGAGSRLSGATGALASLLPLSWFITGHAMEFGFFNVHFALSILYAGIIVYFGAKARPAVCLGLLMIAAMLLLATWSPLVLLPAALGAVVVLRHWKSLRSLRGGAAWFLGIATAQVIAYGLLMVLPSLLAVGGALAADGGVFPFDRLMLPFVIFTTLVLTVLVARGVRCLVAEAAIALVAASGVGLVVLLAAAWGGMGAWTYYPIKFAWLATAVLVVFSFGLILPVAARVVRGVAGRMIAVGVLAATVLAFIVASPTVDSGERRLDPVRWILGGNVAGEEATGVIFALADPEHPRVLWRSEVSGEGFVNFWVLQMWAEDFDESADLRTYAYNAHSMTEVGDLCAILGLMGPRVEVTTADPALAGEIAEDCPSAEAIVVVAKADD